MTLFKSAAHLILMKENKVLLIRRYNTGYEDGKYSLVAGHLESNESVKQAMIREANEEVGINIDENMLEVVGVMHRKSNNQRIDFFLMTRIWSGEVINNEPNKCDDLLWIDIDVLPDNTIPYIEKAIANYKNNKWFDTFGI